MPAGAIINSLGFSISESAVSLANYEISMGLTTQSTCQPYISTLTSVKGPFTYTPVVQTAGNFDMLAFTTNFTWDGTSNIVVNICTGSNPFTSPYGGLRYTAATSGEVTYNRVDGSSNCALTSLTSTTYKPNIRFDYTSSSPGLSTAPSSLNFGYVAGGGTSTEQTYVLSGVNLTAGPIVVTAPSGFEVSLSSGSGFGSSVNVSYTPPTLANTTIYVRFKPPVLEASYSGNITNVGGGASKNVAVTGSSDLYTKYCTSTATSASDEDIFNVTLGTLNNSSTCATTGGIGSVLNMYSNYTTTVAAPNLEQGSSNAFSVQIGTCGGTYTNAIKIFIDFNQDGDFNDAGELVYVSAAPLGSGAHTETGNIAVPGGATLGNTLMRVINRETSDTSTITACSTYSWGETEDYLVNIVVATSPTLAVVPSSLNFGSTVPSGGTSAEQTYALSGVNLTPASGNITVTAPANFEVSLTTGSGFSSSINVPYSGSALASTTIFVVFKPTSPSTAYSGNISNAGGGATTVNVAVSGQSACGAVTVSYSQSFDGTTFPPLCWSLINNGTGNQWTRVTSGTYLGAGVMQYYYNSTNAGNAWAFTPEVTLQNGKVYRVTFWQKVGLASYPEKLKVTVGNAPTVVAQTTVLWDNAGGTELTNTTYEKRTAEYTCTSTGSYYFAFNCYSDADEYYLNVDEVSIDEVPANDAGTVSIDVPIGNLPGVIIPKATVKNFGTATNTFNVTMEITGGYTSTKTVTSLTYGATQQVTFDNWTAAIGSYTVKVYTQLAGDAVASNDTLTKNVEVALKYWAYGNNYPTTTYLGSGAGYTTTTLEAVTGYLYSIGGNTTSGLGTECYKYNVNTDTWSAIASLPSGRRVLATAIVGDYLYAIAGSDMASTYQSTVYKYDIAGNSWSTVASLPLAIGWGKAVGYGNYIYFAGGVDAASAVLSTVYVYDVSADTWSAATSMPGPKFGGAFSIADGKLVYVAGADASIISSVVYVGTISPTNPLSITWITAKSKYPGLPAGGVKISGVNDMRELFVPKVKREEENSIRPTEVNYPAGAMYRFDGAPWGYDGIIVAGGSPTADWVPASPNPCYIYQPATDTWTQQANVPTPVLGSSLGTVNLGSTWKLIVASGLGGSAETNVTQVYTVKTSSLNLTALIEGFYDGSTLVPDVVAVELHNSSSPYAVVEKSKALLSSSGTATVGFLSATDATNYYIAVNHRNSIQTWSANPQQFSAGALSYNFTTSQSQAFGSNMKNVGGEWCIYNGDVVRDEFIDGSDVSDVFNASNAGASGYIITDLTGDDFVDGTDVSIAFNNSNLGVGAAYPTKKKDIPTKIQKVEVKTTTIDK
jgi:hypothetical protein